MPIWGWIIIAVIVILVIAIVGVYNGLVKLRVRVDEAWSDITVQLKRRSDMFGNLVEAVKGSAKFEQGVLENVTKARAALTDAISSGAQPANVAKAENALTRVIGGINVEAYPQLASVANYTQLMNEITDTEDKIQASRRFYNGGVRDLNTKIQVFPSNIFAAIFGFKQREFFETDDRDELDKGPKNQTSTVEF